MFGLRPLSTIPSRYPNLLNPDWDRLFDNIDLPLLGKKDAFVPSVDVQEGDKELKISAELPGMTENDIKVSLQGNRLSISGEKKEEVEEKGANSYRLERRFGSFERVISLPDGIDDSKIEATYKNGVLEVVVPKAPGQESKKITVQSGTGTTEAVPNEPASAGQEQ
jgi:HSP20 family protein